MKVTYSTTIGHKMSTNTVGTRILTQNLLRNDKLDVSFNLSPVAMMLDVFKEMKNLEKDPEMFSRFKYATRLWQNEAETMLVTISHIDDFLETIKSEYFLYTMGIGMFDLLVIKRALERGLKVVAGGGYALSIPFDRTRFFLKDMGCSDSQLKNLILVKGFVDLTTDIHQIIKGGQDYVITENDFTTFWDCQTDYFNPYLNVADKIWAEAGVPIIRNDPSTRWHFSYVAFTFSSKCWWNRCKFCLYTNEDICLNLLRNIEPEVVAEKMLETMKLHKSNAIYLSDNYFLFNHRNEKVLEILKNNGMKIGIYTGITKLKEKEYVEKLNKYISYVNIGLESASSFTLDYVDKGYKQEDVYSAFTNIMQNGSTDVTYLANVIFDLPYYDRADFNSHAGTLLTIYDRMKSKGFHYGYNARLLAIPVSLKHNLVDNHFIKESDIDDPNEFGRTIIWKYLTQKYGFDITNFRNFGVPFKRYDTNGKILEPDIQMLSEDESKILGGYDS